jgi:thermitase
LKIVIRMLLILALVSSLVLTGLPSFAANPEQTSADFATDRILVKFKAGVTKLTMQADHKLRGNSTLQQIDPLNIQVIKIPDGKIQSQLKAYRNDPLVEYAEPDYIMKIDRTPNDTDFKKQWGLTTIQAPQAWDITTGDSNVVIAILDTGIDQDHEDLAAKIVANQNFTSSTTVDDLNGHGTHVAGIAAAITNNGKGVAGVACNASLMNIKVMEDTGSGFESSIAAGIIWAADNGAKVINMSLGGLYGFTVWSAVDYAWNRGVVLVAAAGNNGNARPVFPAFCTNCIAVAAMDQNDTKASFSSYGTWVDVAAPGVSIYSTLPNHPNAFIALNYGSLSGTSMATPFVSGLAALIWATPFGTSNSVVRSHIESTADAIIGTGNYWQYGRINAFRAVNAGSSAVSTNTATVVTSTSAILNGNLFDLDAGTTVEVFFDYGTSLDYGNSTSPQIMSNTGAFSAEIAGLYPDTTYYFRARASGIGQAFGMENIFNTWSKRPEGKIAFASTRDFDSRIYVMNADGSNQTCICSIPGYCPAISPDGTKIAYSRSNQIWIMDIEGSNPVQLTSCDGGNTFPAWSPDGSKIAFVSSADGNGEISIINTDGNSQINLTNNKFYSDLHPSWSPDGTQIVFDSDRTECFEIYKMNADGSNLIRLTYDSAYSYNPKWSPDGRKILFVSNKDSNHEEIYTMNPDGSDPVKLLTTQYNLLDIFPTWSPDGSQIAFSMAMGPNTEIFIMNVDGSTFFRLTNDTTSDNWPSWGLDAATLTKLNITGYPTSANAGTAYDFIVSAQDGLNNTVTDYAGAVHFTSSDPEAVLPADYTFVAGDNGTHSFSATLKTAGNQSVSVVDTVQSDIKCSQSGITVNPAAKSKLVWGIQPAQTVVPGETWPVFTVKIVDCYGNQTIDTDIITIIPSSGNLNGTLNCVAATGIATFSNISRTMTGTLTLTATSGTLTPTPASNTITLNRYSTLTNIISLPNPSIYGQSVTFTAKVRAVSPAKGTPTGTVTIKKNGSLMPDGIVGLTAGQATYTISNLTAGTHNIIAEYSGDQNFQGSTGSLPHTVIPPPLIITTDNIPRGVVGIVYSQSLEATGGSSTGYQWAILDGSLPGWANLDNETGVISGTPDVTSNSTFTVQLTDDAYNVATKEFSLSIVTIGLINTLPPAEVKATYMPQTLVTVGGTPPYKYAKSGTWPAGLILSQTGTISGTPTVKITAPTEYTLAVKVTDSTSTVYTSGNRNPANRVVILPTKITIFPALNITLEGSTKTLSALPTVDANSAFTCELSASGGKSPYTWSKGTDFPEWLNLDASIGALSGKPSIDGIVHKVEIVIKDSLGYTFTKSPLLRVNKALSITTTALPDGEPGLTYKTATLKASGGASKKVWSITEDLPSGLTFSSKGVLKGKPVLGSSGVYPITLQVSDGIAVVTQDYEITIYDPLSINPLPGGVVGDPYSHVFTATGGSGGNQFSIIGMLPKGLEFNSKTATLSGIPTRAGTYKFRVKVTDSLKGSLIKEVIILISSE